MFGLSRNTNLYTTSNCSRMQFGGSCNVSAASQCSITSVCVRVQVCNGSGVPTIVCVLYAGGDLNA